MVRDPARSGVPDGGSAWVHCLRPAFLLGAMLFGTPVIGAAYLPQAIAAERAADDTAVSAPSLEPEFRRLRDDLRALPQYQGTDALTHEQLARELARRGDMDGAASEYRQAIRLDPQLASAYRGLGAVLLDRHEYGEAAEVLAVSVGLREGDAEAWYWLGRARLARRDFSGAAEALRKSLQLNPDDAEPAADLGLVRMAQGDHAGASDALRRAIRLKPDHAEAHHRLELVRKAGHDSDALKLEADRILTLFFSRE